MAEEKLKILYLMKILLEETDQDHILNASELNQIMQDRYQMTCNRKTIYSDVEKLQRFGLEIRQVKGDRQGYYVAERDFSLPELKLLVDAVQSSRFIPSAQSEELIRKLEKMTTHDNALQLQRQVFIYNRPKTTNETVFQNVDQIYSAMYRNRRICFQYCEWTVKKELVPRRDGKIYEVSPWSLTWDDANYYLVAYEEASGQIRHYRVDKMKRMQISNHARNGREEFRDFDLAAFSKKTFGMFAGEDTRITLECEKHLAGVVIDRFGTDTMIRPYGPDHFRAQVFVAVSPQFFGWVAGIGEGMKIAEPAHVKGQYREYLKRILRSYET